MEKKPIGFMNNGFNLFQNSKYILILFFLASNSYVGDHLKFSGG